MLKTFGYSISSLSVLLLGAVSWDGAKSKPALLACLVVGMASSIVGMICRWGSYLREKRKRKALEQTVAHERSEPRLAAGAAAGRPDAAGPRGLDRLATGA